MIKDRLIMMEVMRDRLMMEMMMIGWWVDEGRSRTLELRGARRISIRDYPGNVCIQTLRFAYNWCAERANPEMVVKIDMKTLPLNSLLQITGQDPIYLDICSIGFVHVTRSEVL